MAEIYCVRGYAHEVEPPIEEDCPMCEMEDSLKRAAALLREWRDRFGGKAVHVFKSAWGSVATASPSDLLRDTNKFLEGK